MITKYQLHSFKVLYHERSIQRSLRELVNNKLSDTNNEILLTNVILSYLVGKCNKCNIHVSNLKYHPKYKNICFTCYYRFQPHP